MADRWRRRKMLPPGQGQLYWHVLFRDNPEVRSTVVAVHERLSGLPGLDLVPHEWLHLTTLIAGLTDEVTQDQIERMLVTARGLLRQVRPITVTLGRVLYHPEAVALEARPGEALLPMLNAVEKATRIATGRDGVLSHAPWTPHVTVAYSKAAQPAAPIIAALGRAVPDCAVTIGSISLVVQDGPEYAWDWRPVAEIPFTASCPS
ncbi:2'-5' RNA ligase family protein [Microtetraspora fusca]|uniref:2'-5' RNA ligase family protein n=1 Tax=Microtetraspora fusca TaxID=1997 RepID=UPI00082E5917|nr:2'-5' RNA ligase family protein [Microtetraspora fusca]